VLTIEIMYLKFDLLYVLKRNSLATNEIVTRLFQLHKTIKFQLQKTQRCIKMFVYKFLKGTPLISNWWQSVATLTWHQDQLTMPQVGLSQHKTISYSKTNQWSSLSFDHNTIYKSSSNFLYIWSNILKCY